MTDTIDLFSRSATLLRMPSWLGSGVHEELELTRSINALTSGPALARRPCATASAHFILFRVTDHTRMSPAPSRRPSPVPPREPKKREPQEAP
ncbi:hypothetical protein [Variovorax sp. JS1663]|uniref:hypothetical protein n=1 Tax=Variovorax sp. JS1663 TaxID=1851577 RepID=UPI00117EFEA7|nr:hypothetical protein [Variovorax sp. JS1663]